MKTIKIYKTNFYEAYRADETGTRFMLERHKDTPYYKSEEEEMYVELPDGYDLSKDNTGAPAIYRGSEYVDFYTDGDDLILVSSDGEVTLTPHGKTYDVRFDDTASNSKGFAESLRYCWDYILAYNGTDESYFADYRGGVVRIVCNETGETMYCESVRDGRFYPSHEAAFAAAIAFHYAFGGTVVDGLASEAPAEDGRLGGAYMAVCVAFGSMQDNPLGESWEEFPYEWVDYE